MMIRPKRFVLVAALLFFGSSNIFAQFFNNGTKLFLDKNAVLFVKDNYRHVNGEVLNNGVITVLGDWKSDNRVFNDASTGTVVMNSTSSTLSGLATFPNLVFKGTGVYQLDGVFDVRLTLDLEDAEVRLKGTEALRLLNPNSLSLVRNNGFINTAEGLEGSFVRYTNADEEYLYPLGSKTLKRFVVIQPKNSSINAFAASFIDKDPNTGGYNRASKSKSVSEINDVYYHHIKRLSGTAASDITFFVPTSEKFTSLAAWARNTQWDRAISVNSQNSSSSASYLAQSILHGNADLTLESERVFALAKVTSDSPLEIYNAFSPDGDGKNDTWEIKNIDTFPDNDLKIFDRSGNLVYRMNGYNSSKYWDGQNVSSGTYIYILRVKIDGRDQHFKGSVTMVKK